MWESRKRAKRLKTSHSWANHRVFPNAARLIWAAIRGLYHVVEIFPGAQNVKTPQKSSERIFFKKPVKYMSENTRSFCGNPMDTLRESNGNWNRATIAY